MQNIRKKFSKIFFILFLLFSQSVVAQEVDQKFTLADSLFKSKKYGAAFAQYEQLLSRDHVFSPRMLLKMAYMRERENDYAGALYYLNLYYRHKPERQVLQKIDELAVKYKLQGYQLADLEYLLALYNYYQTQVILLIILLLTGFWLYLYRRRQQGKEILFPAILLAFLLGVFFYTHNYGAEVKKGIIKSDKALLMQAPSAGSEQVELAQKGHLVEIIDKEDIWYKIKWNEKKLYIRETNLYVID